MGHGSWVMGHGLWVMGQIRLWYEIGRPRIRFSFATHLGPFSVLFCFFLIEGIKTVYSFSRDYLDGKRINMKIETEVPKLFVYQNIIRVS